VLFFLVILEKLDTIRSRTLPGVDSFNQSLLETLSWNCILLTAFRA
jgi:hypothetical protein